MSNAERLAKITQEIAALEAEKRALETLQEQPWPRHVTVYLHGSKESMYDKGRDLGLDDNACEQFMYCCYEVAIEIEVEQNGTSRILGCEGRQFTGL